jgi:tetratricopeptide (TPR) repeat protein
MAARMDARGTALCGSTRGETDEDLDLSLSQRSWTEALALVQKVGDTGWANRARGELGLVAFLQGDTNTAIVNLGQAIKVAETNGDTSSLVRWLTLFGHGYMELGRPEQASNFYERALKVARAVPELQMPFMTLVGKAHALVKVGRASEAEELVLTTLPEAATEGSLGYQAELTLRLAFIHLQRKQTDQALDAMSRAAAFARAAGGNRLLAGISLERARVLRAANQLTAAKNALRDGIDASRNMGERILLPRLLSQLAEDAIAERDVIPGAHSSTRECHPLGMSAVGAMALLPSVDWPPSEPYRRGEEITNLCSRPSRSARGPLLQSLVPSAVSLLWVWRWHTPPSARRSRPLATL